MALNPYCKAGIMLVKYLNNPPAEEKGSGLVFQHSKKGKRVMGTGLGNRPCPGTYNNGVAWR
jgi:hypothetical protein